MESDVPKRVPDDEKSNVLLVCIVKDGVALGFNHVPIGEEDRFTVECFLGADQGPWFQGTSVIQLARRSFWTIRMLV